MADPFTSAFNFDNTNYSLGAGIRFKRLFIDLAYNLNRRVSDYTVYDFGGQLANTVTLDHNIVTTVGFRF